MATKLRNLKITAVALVDKGANQHAEVLLYKRAESLDKMDTEGVPLTTQEILDHQAQSEVWHELRVAVEKDGRVIAGQRLQRLKQAVMALQNIISEAEPVTQKGAPMADKSLTPTIEDVTKRAVDAEAQVTTLQTQVATLEKRVTDADAEVVKLQPTDPWAGVSTEVRKRIEASEERVAKAESEVRKRDCITQVQVYKALPVNPDDDWEVFDHVNTMLPEASRKRFYALLSAADEGMRQSSLFKSQGASSTRTSNGGSAYAVIESQARELVTKGLAKTLEQGIDRVIQDNPDLFAQFEAERRGA